MKINSRDTERMALEMRISNMFLSQFRHVNVGHRNEEFPLIESAFGFRHRRENRNGMQLAKHAVSIQFTIQKSNTMIR